MYLASSILSVDFRPSVFGDDSHESNSKMEFSLTVAPSSFPWLQYRMESEVHKEMGLLLPDSSKTSVIDARSASKGLVTYHK